MIWLSKYKLEKTIPKNMNLPGPYVHLFKKKKNSCHLPQYEWSVHGNRRVHFPDHAVQKTVKVHISMAHIVDSECKGNSRKRVHLSSGWSPVPGNTALPAFVYVAW